ncbi:MAG TPA: divalent metal cation transporter, partial [Corynebacterium variabile]|nr:divalent metal cation transporter [Corynebacterium variabile]
RIPILLRRLITMVPGLVVLGVGIDPTWALILSQVILSVGIPFALVPLVAMTAKKALMGTWVNARALSWTGWFFALVIIALNVVLIWLTVIGEA